MKKLLIIIALLASCTEDVPSAPVRTPEQQKELASCVRVCRWHSTKDMCDCLCQTDINYNSSIEHEWPISKACSSQHPLPEDFVDPAILKQECNSSCLKKQRNKKRNLRAEICDCICQKVWDYAVTSSNGSEVIPALQQDEIASSCVLSN